MARFSRRKAVFAAAGAMALALFAGGIATAAPSNEQAAPPASTGDQPRMSKADADKLQQAQEGASVSSLPVTARASSAVVASNGVLVRGVNVVSSARLALGQYQVIFNHPVNNGTFVATIGLTGSAGISPPGEIAVVGRTGNVNGVFVQTFNSAGAPTDRSFHLAVLD